MVKIDGIDEGSPADKAGLRTKDYLVLANGNILRDALDVQFYIENEKKVEIEFQRAGSIERTSIINPKLAASGLHPHPIGIKKCKNKCIFCFIDQLPKGLRKSLYVKDEDIRHSFLYGNYITLTDIPECELERVIEQKMSPVHISVHSLDEKIRKALLGKDDVQPIYPLLRRLTENGVRIHSQIVVVPGHNDSNEELTKTIRGLFELGENSLSCALVPVGLTKFRMGLAKIEPISSRGARRIMELSEKLRKSFDREDFLQIADELIILSGSKIPEAEYYGDFPQFENGVGIVRSTIDDALECKKKEIRLKIDSRKKLRIDIVTGTRGAKILGKCFPINLGIEGVEAKIVTVENLFFGKSVTAANLLTARDILREISKSESDIICLPPKVLNEDRLFLDGVTINELEKRSTKKFIIGCRYLSELQKIIIEL